MRDQQRELLNIPQLFEDLFNGTLGKWKTYSIYFEPKENTKPGFQGCTLY